MRADDALKRRLNGLPDQGDLCLEPGGPGPDFECALRRPAGAPLQIRVTVRTRAGIPLAASVITLESGAEHLRVPALPLLAMEGYAHLKDDERQVIERRVWARRGFVTLEEA